MNNYIIILKKFDVISRKKCKIKKIEFDRKKIYLNEYSNQEN